MSTAGRVLTTEGLRRAWGDTDSQKGTMMRYTATNEGTAYPVPHEDTPPTLSHAELGAWLTALESGQSLQYQGGWRGYRPDGQTGQCCLDVLLEVIGGSSLALADQLGDPVICRLARLNDDGPLDQYQRVLAELKEAMEDYVGR